MASPLVTLVCTILAVNFASCLDPIPVVTKPMSGVISASAGTNFELRCDVTNRRNDLVARWEYMPPCTSVFNCLRSTITDGQGALDQQKYALRFVGSDTYILIIKNINLNDVGNYYCSIQVNRNTKVDDNVFVQVVQVPLIDPLQTSSSMTVDLGTDVALSCVAQGIPMPVIKWERAGKSPLPSGSLQFVGSVLRLTSVKPNFEGPYVCTASNSAGDASQVITLSVRYQPQIVADNAIVQQAIGYQVKMYCNIESNPVADTVWWTRNGIDVSTMSRFKTETLTSAGNRLVTKLVVSGGVTADDYNSKFRCGASNDLGESFATISIAQVSSPLPLAGKILTGGATITSGSSYVAGVVVAIMVSRLISRC